jgi:Tfp pilus assembly protein PilF
MSLINQMLKDLEQRSRPIKNSGNYLSELKTTSFSHWKSRKNHYLFIMSILLFCIGILFNLHVMHKKNKAIHLITLKSAPFMQESVHSSVTNNNFNELHATASIVTGLTLQVQKENTLIRVLLSQDTLYRISQNARNDYIIVLNHARLLTSLPSINTVNSAIDNIQMINQDNGNLYIIVSPKKNAEFIHLDLISQGKYPELQMEFLYKAPEMIESNASTIEKSSVSSEPETTGTLTKSLISVGPEEEYQAALQYSSQGNLTKAQLLLSQLVVKYPEYTSARESLVKILLEQDKQLQADMVLQVGLQQKPLYPPYAELKARILVKEGKMTDAINLLQKSAPAINSNPDYHAFIAALYQRQGQSLLAAKLYEQLIPLEPENGVWWMGLGIAYENLGKHSEALQAYARADRIDQLNPELKAYIESRIHSLQ